MLSGLKFIPRDQIATVEDGSSDESLRERHKSAKNENERKRRPGYSSSDDEDSDDSREKKHKHRSKGKERRKRKGSFRSSDEELERIKKGSRRKWYTSSDDLLSYSDGTASERSNGRSGKKQSRKKERRRHDRSLKDESRGISKNLSSVRKDTSSAYGFSSSENEDVTISGRKVEQDKKNILKRSDDSASLSLNNFEITRKEMGLDWMLRPNDNVEKSSNIGSDPPAEPATNEIKKMHPKELNPYLKDNGSGYPEESEGTKAGGVQLLSSSVVGDGGVSWRLKALKRAKEQAAREGRKFEEVVQERWGSLGDLTVSVASKTAAPAHAHLHAIRNRSRGLMEDHQTLTNEKNDSSSQKNIGWESRQNHFRNPKMKVPKLHDSLSWGKRKTENKSTEDATIISSAMSSLNHFSDDGSFMQEFMHKHNDTSNLFPGSSSHSKNERKVEAEFVSSEKHIEHGVNRPSLSANQLAAKCLQLRLKGKHEEAEKLMKEAEQVTVVPVVRNETRLPQTEGAPNRYIMHDLSSRQKKKREDPDMHLAQKIVQNKQYSMSGRADDEYDYDGDPRRKSRKKGGEEDHKSNANANFAKRIMTQKERCQFCFENPSRPRHLVVSVANFSYLMLPQWQSVVPGHCCILPMQHESSTRAVDNNVWDEIRNFKKCLIMMFAEQEKSLVFLETVMWLTGQRRHCMVECIPLPQQIAKQAPLYFKKAIDEAEDEWSQHNAKKLIDTSQKGLRGSIPKDFPYFHVEFGLDKGFVHVIDDEKEFKSSFGLNVIRGMLKLPAEDMHRGRRLESVDAQKEAVTRFATDWEAFDWTKQLD